MRTHRDGKPVVVCDGCYQVIVDFKPRVHNGHYKGTHVCSTQCAKKTKNNRPTEQRCRECNVRVATGALACMNGHTQAVACRVRGVAVKRVKT